MDFHASPRSFAQAVKFIGCRAFHFKISYNIYTPLYIPENKLEKVELHPSYQNLVATLDLVSRPRTSSLALGIALLRLCTRVLALALVYSLSPSRSRSRPHVLALALTYSFSPSRSRSRPRFLTLVITFPRSPFAYHHRTLRIT